MRALGAVLLQVLSLEQSFRPQIPREEGGRRIVDTAEFARGFGSGVLAHRGHGHDFLESRDLGGRVYCVVGVVDIPTDLDRDAVEDFSCQVDAE